MDRLNIHQDWWNELVGEGLPYPSSTLISGPGGSGKPLIGFAFVYEWLKAGGNIVSIPLQYPNTEFADSSLKKIYGLDIEKYSDRTTYIQFDPDIDDHERVDRNTFRANLLRPVVWDKVIKESEASMPESGLGTLVSGSALNLLLFSPTYKDDILDHFEKVIGRKKDRERTYIFSASTSAFREDIERWERVADNLFFARMKEDMTLYLRIGRIGNREVSTKEVSIPIEKELLKDIREIAEDMRIRRIPQLSLI